MLSDIEIAESAELQDIREIAKKLNLTENELELYGKYKAKIALPANAERKAKLILVTAINPTSSGEGKTTVSIGLAQMSNGNFHIDNIFRSHYRPGIIQNGKSQTIGIALHHCDRLLLFENTK